MEKQLRLIEMDADTRIIPDPHRRSPAVWIQELRVLRELSDAEEHLVRRVVLHRGMNILWAKPADGETEGTGLFEDSLSGHAAGKTTFCRFLRHILGEAHFGDELLRAEVRVRFPRGWVVAHVFIDDDPWVVCRPFAVGAHPFALRTSIIAEALDPDAQRLDFDKYLDALASAALRDLPVRQFSASRGPILWDHVLPWIARDQECHFDRLIEWRDASTDSRSPQLDATERHLLLRALLKLVSDEEDRERRENEERLSRRKAIRAELPKLAHQSQVDRERLRVELGGELPPVEDGLFREACDNAIEELATALRAQQRDEVGEPAIRALEGALETAIREEGAQAAVVRNITRELEDKRAELQSLRGTITEAQRLAFKESLGPSSGFCNVPVDVAREAGCPVVSSRPAQFVQAYAEKGLDERAEMVERILRSLEGRLREEQAELTSRSRETQAARYAVATARRTQKETIRHATGLEAHISNLRRLAGYVASARTDEEQLKAEDLQLEAAIGRSNRRQEELRMAATQAMRAFSEKFDYFICALLGREVVGRASFSGRDIGLTVFCRGERRSSAIRIVKNLAFDLTALVRSIEGYGCHPRILIHDGPRASDMSADLYRKLFRLVRMIEGCGGEGTEPAFQYIVTTTEPPAVELQRPPWLLDPVLDAAIPEKRFLGVDL
ncbi:MAG: hypothetical protein KY476_00455 [Planctomycetes bacterium]|nr:hypothetical protein [Planctomycetota bacterium]